MRALVILPFMNVAIYARLSRNRDGESTSIERQLSACRAKIAAEGWTEVATYTDDDLSAYRPGVRRPQYEQMLKDAERGAFDLLLVWKSDRLVRRMAEFLRVSAILDKAKIGFASATEPIDSSTTMGQIVLNMLVGFAQMESENTSLRQRSKHAELRERGRWSGGRRAFGLNDRWDALVPEEAELIRKAADRLLDGGSLASVVRDWNQGGVTTRTGKRWDATTLRRMLLSPRMVGRRRIGSELSREVGIPPVIDDETWQRLRALLTNPRTAGPGNAPKYLLAGMVVCGNCGSRMHTHSHSATRRRYQCSSVRGGCGRVSIDAAPAERAVADAWLDYTRGDEFRAWTREREDAREASRATANELSERIATLTARRNGLIDLWVSGELSQDEWRRGRGALDREIADADEALARAESDSSDVSVWGFEGLAFHAWESATVDTRRDLLRAVADKIVIHPAKGRGRRFDATRIEPFFRSPDGLHPGELARVTWLPASHAGPED